MLRVVVLVVLLMIVVTINELVQGESLIPYCVTSSQTLNQTDNGLIISGALSKQLGRSIVCQFTDNTSASFLGIQAWKYPKTSNGSLRVDVYDSKLQNNIGRLETKTKTSRRVLVCLEKIYSEYVVIISGTPLLNFTVKVDLVSHPLQLLEEKTFTGPMLFSFSLPVQALSNEAQLDITITSTDNEQAMLIVSSSCDQVEKRGVINRKKPRMSLTFQRQARSTVSKVSRPALNATQPLFIGVLMQSQEESRNDKNFTIKITTFNYSYAAPICFIVFVPAVGGIIVALWALFSFREPLRLDGQTAASSSLDSSSASSIKVSKASSMACWTGHSQPNEMTPLIRQPRIKLTSTCVAVTKAMFKVLRYHWVGYGSRAYSYLTCVVGFVLFVGAFQFVYENWNIMIEEGDRDKCFYDDLCYRASPYSDIPFNLMISNMAYVVHGIVLAVTVWIMEAELYVQANKKAQLHNINKDDNQNTSTDKEALPRHTLLCSNISAHLPELSVPSFHCDDEKQLRALYAKAYQGKYSFSVGYAFAWALVFEGIFSLTYHLCPSRLTFQFDSAFMFVISGLIIVSLFNGLSVRQCQQQECLPRPILDTSFYLFVIVPLYLLNYLGSVYNVENRDTKLIVVVVFWVFIISWYSGMLGWAGGKLFYNDFRNGFHSCASKVKVVLFCVTVVCTCIVFPWLFHNDLSHLFLFSSITIAVISTIGKIILNALKEPPARYATWEALLFKATQVAYVLVALAIMAAAVYVFQGIPTTDKTDTPSLSRNLNKECALLGFYDYHDIWHIMSSFALLMGAFLVMYISE